MTIFPFFLFFFFFCVAGELCRAACARGSDDDGRWRACAGIVCWHAVHLALPLSAKRRRRRRKTHFRFKLASASWRRCAAVNGNMIVAYRAGAAWIGVLDMVRRNVARASDLVLLERRCGGRWHAAHGCNEWMRSVEAYRKWGEGQGMLKSGRFCRFNFSPRR